MEPGDPVTFPFGPPLAPTDRLPALAIRPERAALRAGILRRIRSIFRPSHLAPTQHLMFVTVRAWHPQPPLVALAISRLNTALPLDRRRAGQDKLPVPERRGSLARQRDGITFRACARRIPIDLVA